jgi:hypothetical protein
MLGAALSPHVGISPVIIDAIGSGDGKSRLTKTESLPWVLGQR